MKRYTVTSTIQNGDNPPVTITWSRTDDLPTAMAAMVSAMADASDVPDTSVPESVRTHVRSVHMEVAA